MIGAVGVDVEGNKHVLGIREGRHGKLDRSDRAAGRHRSPRRRSKRKMLFVIDGSKALRAAINAVFGAEQPVQRCRAHKAAQCTRLSAQGPAGQQGAARGLETRDRRKHAPRSRTAAWLDNSYPSAAASLLKTGGVLHHQSADIPPALHRCCHHQHHRSPHAGSSHPDRRVTHWQNGKMVLRWMGFGLPQNREAIQNASWAIAISGLWKPISTPVATAGQRRRS